MKILKTETYKKLIESYAPKYSAITYKEHCEILEKELKQAKDLKEILNKFSSMSINGFNFATVGGCFDIGYGGITLPDNVLVYVDDILGGKVIKQEGNKCLVIDKDGNVKTGLTKQKPDKGYNYKLVRE